MFQSRNSTWVCKLQINLKPFLFHYYWKVQKNKNRKNLETKVFLIWEYSKFNIICHGLGEEFGFWPSIAFSCTTSKAKMHYSPNFFNLRVLHIFSDNMLVIRPSWFVLCYFCIKNDSHLINNLIILLVFGIIN